MPDNELTLESFFASRAGVCVYVTLANARFRVQFADPSSEGVVAEADQAGAEEARRIAHQAMRQHAVGLGPLFAKVARALT
jgi:hypothetical protein